MSKDRRDSVPVTINCNFITLDKICYIQRLTYENNYYCLGIHFKSKLTIFIILFITKIKGNNESFRAKHCLVLTNILHKEHRK